MRIEIFCSQCWHITRVADGPLWHICSSCFHREPVSCQNESTLDNGEKTEKQKKIWECWHLYRQRVFCNETLNLQAQNVLDTSTWLHKKHLYGTDQLMVEMNPCLPIWARGQQPVIDSFLISDSRKHQQEADLLLYMVQAGERQGSLPPRLLLSRPLKGTCRHWRTLG